MERGENMASALWGKFASEVLKEVGFKYDHNAIRQELVEHMEELYEDLQAEGMDAHVAEVMAVEYMGDAAEIGKALNEEHSPLLGWVWRVSRWAVRVVFLCSILWWAGSFIRTTVIDVFDKYEERAKASVVYSVDVDETVEAYGERIHFDEILYYDDGMLEIRATTWNWKRRGNESALTRANRITVADETGKRYEIRISTDEDILFLVNREGIYFKSQIFVLDFPKDAEKLYISYDWEMKNFVAVDLQKGGAG